MANIDGLLFDMDGLLLDTEAIAQEAFVETVGPLGMAEATARTEFLYFIGGHATENGGRMRGLFPDRDAKAIERAWVAAFEARIAQGVPLRPTVEETLRALAQAGFPMAVVTSSSRAHAKHNLGATGLLPLFKGIIPGDEVTQAKPHPEPYERGAALLGFAPQRCAAFEDSDAGITAATSAGCQSVQIPDMRPPERPLPELGQQVAETLAEAVATMGLLALAETPRV